MTRSVGWPLRTLHRLACRCSAAPHTILFPAPHSSWGFPVAVQGSPEPDPREVGERPSQGNTHSLNIIPPLKVDRINKHPAMPRSPSQGAWSVTSRPRGTTVAGSKHLLEHAQNPGLSKLGHTGAWVWSHSSPNFRSSQGLCGVGWVLRMGIRHGEVCMVFLQCCAWGGGSLDISSGDKLSLSPHCVPGM